jgi:anti-sigma-K factor RskA
MTHEDYESIAALDAVGAASAEEERMLRDHLATCASCRTARDEFGEAAALLARQTDPVAPPPDVRDRILGAIDANDAEVVDIESRRKRPWWLATAAMLFLALWGWREVGIRVSREHLRSQRAEIERLQSENATLAQQKEKLSAAMSAMAASGTRSISLAGAQAAPTASARVFLDESKRRAFVFFYDLPANANDKSYQLWILRADQPKPQSAGIFDATKDGTASVTIENLPLATEIKGLAVTLEPKGGGEQPSNANFYVVGNT